MAKRVNSPSREEIPDLWEMALDFEDFISAELPERPIIVEPWLRRSSLAMVYSERGVGKTWFALSIALSVATGASIGSWGVSESVGVLYVDGEMSSGEMQTRLRLLSEGLPSLSAPLKLLSSDLIHQKGCPSVKINEANWRNHISNALQTQKAIRVLILDNVSCLTPGIDENTKESWDQINQWLLELRFSGISVIFLHHAGKGGAQRGTSGREDALDVVIRLSHPIGYKATDGARFTVTFEKSRGLSGGALSPFVFSIGDDADGKTVWLTDAPTASNNKGKIIALLGYGKSPSEIEQLVGCTKQNISKHKKWAFENGYLYEEKGLGQCAFTEKGREKYGFYLFDF